MRSSSLKEMRFPFSMAPMVGITHRYFRRFLREITKNTILYTPMIHSHTIFHLAKSKKLQQLLSFDNCEHPIILQLAGNNPEILAEASQIAEHFHYDGINLNLGCPASCAKHGYFGAALMNRPKQISECIDKIRQVCSLPISTKHRLGIDIRVLDNKAYQLLKTFIRILSDGGCSHFIVHARTAILAQNISTKANHSIPPLDYNSVLRLAQDFPKLCFEINGGIHDIDEGLPFLQNLSGVMIGRAAVKNPLLFYGIDSCIDHQYTQLQDGIRQSSNSDVLAQDAFKQPKSISLTTRLKILHNYLDFLMHHTGIPLKIDTSDLDTLCAESSLVNACAKTHFLHVQKEFGQWREKIKNSSYSYLKLIAPLARLFVGMPSRRILQKLL